MLEEYKHFVRSKAATGQGTLRGSAARQRLPRDQHVMLFMYVLHLAYGWFWKIPLPVIPQLHASPYNGEGQDIYRQPAGACTQTGQCLCTLL